MSAVLGERRDAAWRPALIVAGLLLAVTLMAHWSTAAAMVAIWSRSETFAHAFLVPPIVVWLIWRQRQALAAQVPRPTMWGLLPVAVASMAWLVGDLAASNAVAQLAFTALLVLVIVATLGPRASRTIAFPLGFLFFSVPIGEFVMPLMMQWTADFTVLALQLTGIPVYREGLQFVVPTGNWSVVEACSGIRYLIASIMVGTLFAYLNYRSLRRRLIFTALSIVVPIVANWLRAYLIVMIGQISGNAAAASADHIIYGWVFFGIVITAMFLIGARWSEAPAEGVMSPAPVSNGGRARGRGLVMAVAVGGVVLLLLPQLALRGMRAAERPGTPLLVPPPTLPGGWRLQDGKATDWSPAFSGAAAEFNRRFARSGDAAVGLYVGYYRHQGYATKLISSENRVVTFQNPNWSAVSTGSRELKVDGTPRRFETTLLRGSAHIGSDTARRLVVWKTYWVDGALVASDATAKLRVALERLLGRGDDAAVVIVYRQGDGLADADDALLAAFVEDTLGALVRSLAQTRDSAAAPPAPP